MGERGKIVRSEYLSLNDGKIDFDLVDPAGMLWIVLRVGATTAEMLESPIILVGTMVAARWTVLRLAVPPMPSLELGWVASHSSLCWLRNSGSCSGFVDCRSINTLPRRTQCREPEYYGDS